ncbi:MAG: phosphotransferase, partial [Planctomycetales bacterium]|nr:phosphotransferase [Planctomycetales bacterium]
EKLAAAVQAVAQIHLVAQSCDTADGDGAVPRRAPSPAVARRAGLAEELLRNGCRDLATKASRFPAGACRDLAVATVRAIETKLPHVARRMAGCREAVLPLGWRLGDARREHVLFTGDAVTGVVDFGAAGVDTPVGDLVRLLGSFVADDSDRWRRGIEAYQSVRPLSDVELRVIEPLRHSEPLLAAANWIGWLSAGAQPADHRDHPGWLRLAELYQRLQSP